MGHVTGNSKIGGYKLSPYTNYFYFTFSGLYAIGNKSGSHQHCIYEKGGRRKKFNISTLTNICTS